MKAPQKIYLVWNDEDTDCSYFEIFDSIADAVNSKGYGTEVFEAAPKSLGLFKENAKAIKLTKKEAKAYLSEE